MQSGKYIAKSVPPKGNSFLEVKIVFYITTIWESGKNIFLVSHGIISASLHVYFFLSVS